MANKPKDFNALDTWDSFGSNYLKASDLVEDKGSFVVTKVSVGVKTLMDGREVPQLELEVLTSDKKEFNFTPNWSNTKAIKDKISTPKELLGARISYEKIRVTNPKTNEIVDSIAVTQVSKTEKA